jgi:hypothetical protein
MTSSGSMGRCMGDCAAYPGTADQDEFDDPDHLGRTT